MKTLLCFLLGTCCMAGIHAQNTITIGGGTRLTTSGNVQLVLGAGRFVNNGTISGTTGTLVFAGPVNFSGTGSTTVQNFTIAHSSSSVSILNAPISVTNTANLMFGNFDANNNLLIRSDLSNSANLVVSGAPTGRVQGIVATSTAAAGACPSFAANLSVNISGPLLTYQWQSSRDSANWSNISGATAGTYAATVSATTFYRCLIGATNTSFADSVPGIKLAVDSPRAAITGVTNLAVGGTSTLNGTTAGGTWSSSNAAVLSVNASSGLITGVSAGTATISYVVTNSGGCTATATSAIAVGNGNKPSITITNPAAICAPGTVNLTAAAVTAGSNAGLTYTYYTNAAATIPVTSPAAVTTSGTYYIVGTNSSSVASDPSPVVVTVNALPSGTLTSVQGTVLCGPTATLPLNAITGNIYAWFKDGVAISGITTSQLTVSATGVYTAAITSTAGCRANAGNAITVTLVQPPKADFIFDSYCVNNPVLFSNTSTTTGSGQVSFQWSDNAGRTSTATSPTFTYTQTGGVNMKLKVTSLVCPALSDSITRTLTIESPAPAIRMKPVNILINEALELQPRSFGSSYLWTPATSLSSATASNPKATLSADQEYRITIKAPSSCITIDTMLVRIFDNRIYVANVFTPNGDGINDKLFVNVAGVRQLHYFRVFNRYAKLVFETNDATIGWDGRFNNALQPMDTYIWVAEVTDKLGLVTIRKGNVTLLR